MEGDRKTTRLGQRAGHQYPIRYEEEASAVEGESVKKFTAIDYIAVGVA